jgi:2-polyprenyl-6-methoxyphenol hydroxylase-like FAD-dependent oxidoreductase
MGSVLVCGGGPIGLLTAMMLARDGHQVTVLESDSATIPATPDQAWRSWPRNGVTQFRLPHGLLALFRRVCDQELPEMTDRLLAAGGIWRDPLAVLPPLVTDREPRPADEALRFVTARRPVIEYAGAAAAATEPGVVIRRDVKVTGLVPGPSAVPGVPHVAGVAISSGEELRADLVVDAMGRRSPAARLLTAIGAREPHEEAEEHGFVYYSRYFTGPARPPLLGPPVVPVGTVTLLYLGSDEQTWSVTVFSSTGDAPLKALRDPKVFSRVVQACPLQAHWLEGLPITGVLATAGIVDRCRRFVVDGSPVVTGYAAVGDSWACTNPSAGRGISVGILHAQLLRRVVRGHLDDPACFAQAWDEGTERYVAPFYWDQIRADRTRFAEMTAAREGREPPPDNSTANRLLAAALYDADLLRAFLETFNCLALPEEVINRPTIKQKLARSHHQVPQAPGPDRKHLLDLLST